MRRVLLKLILFTIMLLVVSGCSVKEDKAFVQSMFQTNGASAVREQTDFLRESLIKYYNKLNKRNPSFYSKENYKVIIREVQNKTNKARLPLVANKENPSYKDYLNIAFAPEYVKDRNDYLILGMYKLFYWAYELEREHTLTTMQYDTTKIQQANKMLQIVQYKIQTAKNTNGDYLFLTWQRAWQVEVLKNVNNNQNIDLEKYTQKELLYSSNMSYQVLSSKMIFTIQESLRYLGVEATNLSAQAIKSVFMFL